MNGTILFVMYYDKYIYIYLYFLEFTVLTFIFYRFVLVTRCRTEMIGQGAYGIVSEEFVLTRRSISPFFSDGWIQIDLLFLSHSV